MRKTAFVAILCVGTGAVLILVPLAVPGASRAFYWAGMGLGAVALAIISSWAVSDALKG